MKHHDSWACRHVPTACHRARFDAKVNGAADGTVRADKQRLAQHRVGAEPRSERRRCRSDGNAETPGKRGVPRPIHSIEKKETTAAGHEPGVVERIRATGQRRLQHVPNALPIVLRDTAETMRLTGRYAKEVLRHSRQLAREIELLAPAVRRGGLHIELFGRCLGPNSSQTDPRCDRRPPLLSPLPSTAPALQPSACYNTNSPHPHP